MARVELAPEFSSLSGRLCGKEKTVIALNKKTGKMHRYDYHAPKSTTPSTDQQATRTSFTTKARAAAQFYNAHKPASGATPDEVWVALKKAYDAQNKYGNIFCFVRSLVNDDNKVVLAGKVYTGGSSGIEV